MILSFSKSHSSITFLPRSFSLSLFIYSLLGAALLAGLCSLVLSTPDPQFLVLYQTVFCLTPRQLHIKELGVRHRFESVELLSVYSDWQVTLIGYSHLNKPCHFFLSFHRSSPFILFEPLTLSLIWTQFLFSIQVFSISFSAPEIQVLVSCIMNSGLLFPHLMEQVIVMCCGSDWYSVTLLFLQWLFHLFTGS